MKESLPLVSIIIPVYNGSNYLDQAIDCALAQSYSNIEVIVVNDGSNDDGETDKIARLYGKKIRYFQKKNGGVATALNFAIQHMGGKYFTWLSHDDLYSLDKIEAQINSLKVIKQDKVIPFCDSEKIDTSSSVIAPVKIRKSHVNNSILLVLSTKVHGCSFLIPKTAFNKIGLFNEELKNTQDVEMWLRLALDGYQFQYVPKVKVRGRIHHLQTSKTTTKRHQIEKTTYFIWAMNHIDPNKLIANKKEILLILFKQNQLKAVIRLITILKKYNAGIFDALPTLVLGGMIFLKKFLSEKCNKIPIYVSITHKIKQRLTQLLKKFKNPSLTILK